MAVGEYATVCITHHASYHISVIGGLGDRVSSVVCSNYPVLVKKIGVNDVFGESGNPDSLLEKHGLTVENIKNTVMSILK